ncbi:hypothetical protein V6N13_041483 [Hibiscus sabdariffa]|uniref:Uncharacterized protein n=1 Tax=Hibiscus sabdariffa TaxID=183260 RepID=A0ABR2RBF5_9ROSI
MQTQAPKVCFSLFVVLSLLANHTISTDSSEHYAPSASESENKSASSESYFSVSPGANIPDIVTESNETLPEENVSTPSDSNEPTDLQTKGEQTLIDQELASSPSVNADTTIETKGDANIPTSPPPIVDNSVLDTRDMDSLSQENTSVPLSNADPPAAETKESSIEDLFQENMSLPPTVETEEEGNNVSQENTLVPSSSPPLLSPAYTVSESPENVPQLNDYSSLSIAAVPAPSEALSYPVLDLDPTTQSTPSNDETYESASTSNQHEIFPSNYRAEDMTVEPYQEEEDSWNRTNGAVACVLVGAFVIGVGGFVYQKRKKDDVKAHHEYECLTKKEGV